MERSAEMTILGTPNCDVCYHRDICPGNNFLKADVNIEVLEVVINKGNDILVENNDEDIVYFLKSGSVQESIQQDVSPVSVSGFHLSWSIISVSGDFEQESSFRYTALERTRLCRVSGSSLRTISLSHTELFFNFLNKYISAIKDEEIFFKIIINKPSEAKVAHFLVNMYRHKNKGLLNTSELVLSMPRSSISFVLGLSIESVSRALKKIDDKDIIEVFNRRITIKDIEALVKISS